MIQFENIIDTIKSFFDSVTELVKAHEAATCGIFTFITIIFVSYNTFTFFRPRAYNVAGYYAQGGRITTDYIDSVQVNYKIVPKSARTLQLYNKIIRQRKTFHKSVALNLMTFNVAIITAQILSIALLFTILAKIASAGWNNVSVGYKSVFVVSTVFSAITYLFSNSYKIEQNIISNLNQHSNYDKTQLDLVKDLTAICEIAERNPLIINDLKFIKRCDSISVSTNRKIYELSKIDFATDFGSIKLENLNGILKQQP